MRKRLVVSLLSAYRLFLEHFGDGLFVGVAEQRHLPTFLLFQLPDGRLLLILGRRLQDVGLQSLVLPVLYFACVPELFPDLELLLLQ